VTLKEYRDNREDFFLGRKIRLVHEIKNGNHVFPLGYIMEIDRKYNGFTLKSVDTCKECGVGARNSITRVHPSSVELLAPQAK